MYPDDFPPHLQSSRDGAVLAAAFMESPSLTSVTLHGGSFVCVCLLGAV